MMNYATKIKVDKLQGGCSMTFSNLDMYNTFPSFDYFPSMQLGHGGLFLGIRGTSIASKLLFVKKSNVVIIEMPKPLMPQINF
jgi:hypothetical protein